MNIRYCDKCNSKIESGTNYYIVKPYEVAWNETKERYSPVPSLVALKDICASCYETLFTASNSSSESSDTSEDTSETASGDAGSSTSGSSEDTGSTTTGEGE